VTAHQYSAGRPGSNLEAVLSKSAEFSSALNASLTAAGKRQYWRIAEFQRIRETQLRMFRHGFTFSAAPRGHSPARTIAMWCIVVNMKRKNGNGTEMRTARTVRASVSFPAGLYRRLEEIARRKKVSLAWVMRDAGELYAAHRDIEGSRK